MDIRTLDQAEAEAKALGAVAVAQYAMQARWTQTTLTYHFFNLDGMEVALFHPSIPNFQAFETPREWDPEIKSRSLSRWRSIPTG